MSEIKTDVEYRFLSGTWHTITIPADKAKDPDYDPEELYNKYWNGGLPDDVNVEEDELDHIWENQEW